MSQEAKKQRNKQIFPRAKVIMIAGIPDQKIPEIREWVLHGKPL
jgi:hypothetical protein